jgi:Fibronectin type III domain
VLQTRLKIASLILACLALYEACGPSTLAPTPVRVPTSAPTSAPTPLPAPTPTAPSAARPPAPNGLAVEVQSPTQALVRWARQPGLTEYRVERKDGDGGSFLEVGVTGPEATTHLNEGLTAGETYVWRLRACNAEGCSPYSEPVSVTMPDS